MTLSGALQANERIYQANKGISRANTGPSQANTGLLRQAMPSLVCKGPLQCDTESCQGNIRPSQASTLPSQFNTVPSKAKQGYLRYTKSPIRPIQGPLDR